MTTKPRRAVGLMRATLVGGGLALLGVSTRAQAATDATGLFFYASCMAADDITAGRPAPSDPQALESEVNKAAMCFGAVSAIGDLQPFLKPEFAMCVPKGGSISRAQMIFVVANYLRNHPEQLDKNFYTLALFALSTAWPCSQ